MTEFNTTLITQRDDFLALSSDWNHLLEQSDAKNIFLTWEWLSTWYQYFSYEKQLWLIVVRDKNNQLMAIAPLMLQKRKLSTLLSITELCFLGNNVGSDHCDFILDALHTERLSNEIISFINKQPPCWDLIHLEGLRKNALAQRILQTLPTGHHSYPITCPYLDLPENWTAYLSSLSKKRRHKIGYYKRKLEQAFPGKIQYQQINSATEQN